MPKIKLSHIVSCSSEDPINNSNNLLNSDNSKKIFLSKNKGEPCVTVIIQFEKSYRISGLDIGNANSAFIEVFVGRSSSKEQEYEIILPMSSFMTPMDAQNMSNCNRVRLFPFDELTESVKHEKWDRIKVICTQPFNKHIQYGLSFIALHTKDKDNDTNDETVTSLGKFHVRPESPNLLIIGNIFSKRKTLQNETQTIRQEIKTSTTPKCTKINIKPSVSRKKTDETDTEIKQQMNRNRQDLFYESDDDKNSEKIDKIMAKAKHDDEQEKKKKLEIAKIKKTNDTSTPPIKKEKPPATSSVSKRKVEQPESSSTKKKQKKIDKKPFNELLKGVVFTISGITNPERANIRQLGLKMGAKYRPDWDNTCTHLICAFANTPKFQQVQGIGKICKKDWIFDCNGQRKRLPWRRYALDKNDQKKPESEDEIHETTIDYTDYLSGSDTDSEIEKIVEKQKNGTKDVPLKDQEDDDVFIIDTDEEVLEKKPKDIPGIPLLFKTEIFYIDEVFTESETNLLKRLIKGFNGTVIKRISMIIDFVITNKESIANIKDRIPNAKFVRSEWILDCRDQFALVPYEAYLLC